MINKWRVLEDTLTHCFIFMSFVLAVHIFIGQFERDVFTIHLLFVYDFAQEWASNTHLFVANLSASFFA